MGRRWSSFTRTVMPLSRTRRSIPFRRSSLLTSRSAGGLDFTGSGSFVEGPVPVGSVASGPPEQPAARTQVAAISRSMRIKLFLLGAPSGLVLAVALRPCRRRRPVGQEQFKVVFRELPVLAVAQVAELEAADADPLQ